MTVTVKCQHTGIEFEADSKRAKNHPAVSRLLNEAVKDKYNPGRYRATIDALEQARADGMVDIDEIISFVNAIVSGDMDANRARRQAEAERERQADREREEARRRRQATNAHLRLHGYKWSKEYADFDEYEEGEPSLWVLNAPDGRAVSVDQALDEIERGADVVLAEIAAREAAESEAKRQAEAAKQAELDAFAATRDAAIHGMVKVEPFAVDRDAMTLVASQQLSYRTTGILSGEINGVPVVVIERYTIDHDDTDFYCTNPGAAGLEEVPAPAPGSLDETFEKFFGS